MCGIAGVWRFDVPANDARTRIGVEAMTAALAHRGPDGHGVACGLSQADAATASAPTFGHTRLAIIDLSPRAAQPMRTPDAAVLVSFNGEIVNHAELRKTLRDRGRHFQSTSDTEVILHAYAEWGQAMVDHFRGMFAIALWDARERTLVLVRDRLGIKPLYLHRSPGLIVFASEVRALLRSGLVPARLDPVALNLYLAYQSVPTPRTLIRDVEMLPPATVTTVTADGECRTKTYWSPLGEPPSPDASRGAARTRVGALVEDAVSSHLVSDVPVGIFLSGGIDSSVLTALVRAAGQVPRTFSVVFPGLAEDESGHARAVAHACGADHTELRVRADEVASQIADALRSIDHPSGDGINTYLVSRSVRAAGIAVALSGIGGDELFGGYPWFARIRRSARQRALWGKAPRALRQSVAAAVRALGSHSPRAGKAASLLDTDGSLAEVLPLTRELFSTRQRRALLSPVIWEAVHDVVDPNVALVRDLVARYPNHGVPSLTSCVELRTYMHDVLLRDTDQMSMCHGLEVRVPLLDHPLVEYVLSLREPWSESDATPKALLLESVAPAIATLPRETWTRPKQGFVLPFNQWMMQHDVLGALCAEHLGEHGLAGRGLMNTRAVSDLWLDFQSPRSTTTWSRPWALVALNAWLASTGATL